MFLSWLPCRGNQNILPGPIIQEGVGRQAMDVKQLRYFLGVLEAGSITSASEILHVAQPAIGMQIRKLEEELGVKLLERHSRGVVATEAGERLKAHADYILKNLDEARRDVVAAEGDPRGKIALGMTTTIVHLVLARVMRSCLRKYPAIALKCSEGVSETLSESLTVGRLDMALTYRPPADPGFIAEALAIESLYLAVPIEHPLAEAQSVTYLEALQCDLIPTIGFSLLSTWREELAAEHGIMPRIVCEAGSVNIIRELVRDGIGCAITPVGAMLADVENKDIAVVPIVDSKFTRTLYLACSRTKYDTTLFKPICEEIRAVVNERIEAGKVGWTAPARRVSGQASASVHKLHTHSRQVHRD